MLIKNRYFLFDMKSSMNVMKNFILNKNFSGDSISDIASRTSSVLNISGAIRRNFIMKIYI